MKILQEEIIQESCLEEIVHVEQKHLNLNRKLENLSDFQLYNRKIIYRKQKIKKTLLLLFNLSNPNSPNLSYATKKIQNQFQQKNFKNKKKHSVLNIIEGINNKDYFNN